MNPGDAIVYTYNEIRRYWRPLNAAGTPEFFEDSTPISLAGTFVRYVGETSWMCIVNIDGVERAVPTASVSLAP